MTAWKHNYSEVGKAVSLTSGRGRGKSSSLGLSIAAAVHLGFTNIFVTAPAPENVQTLWDFILLALKAMNYKEFED